MSRVIRDWVNDRAHKYETLAFTEEQNLFWIVATFKYHPKKRNPVPVMSYGIAAWRYTYTEAGNIYMENGLV